MSIFIYLIVFIKIFVLNIILSDELKLANEMIFIPDGFYTPLFKQNNNEKTDIFIEKFYINKYPITNEEFKSFIKDNPEWSISSIKSIFADRNYLSHWKENEIFADISDKPVVNVSWFAAEAYCNYIKARLPNIDEWEYVASFGDKELNSKDPIYLKKVLDWYIKGQSKTLISRKNMEVNYLGVYGLHSSIWEWVNDFNSVILINTDAEGGGLEEILYCGATATNAIDPSDYMSFMRFAFRNSLEANYTITKLGFRCAKNY